MAFLYSRDGDTVVIRVSPDGKTLEIGDNHVADPTAVVPDPEVNAQSQDPN
jgi:ATP-dependent Clp protease ATP-binding subunit ClpB